MFDLILNSLTTASLPEAVGLQAADDDGAFEASDASDSDSDSESDAELIAEEGISVEAVGGVLPHSNAL